MSERLQGISAKFREQEGNGVWKDTDGDGWPNWLDITPEGGNNRRRNGPSNRPKFDAPDLPERDTLADAIERGMDGLRKRFAGESTDDFRSRIKNIEEVTRFNSNNRASMGVPSVDPAEIPVEHEGSEQKFYNYGFINGEPVAIYQIDNILITDRGDVISKNDASDAIGRYVDFTDKHEADTVESRVALIQDLFDNR